MKSEDWAHHAEMSDVSSWLRDIVDQIPLLVREIGLLYEDDGSLEKRPKLNSMFCFVVV